LRELNLAVTLRANEASILTTRLVFTAPEKKAEAWMPCVSLGSGVQDSVWARRDPDLITFMTTGV